MQKRRMGILVACAVIAVLFPVFELGAADIGQLLKNVTLKDGDDNDAKIPGFGEKVLFVIYADTQTADDNDPVANAIRAENFDPEKYLGVGVANMKDSWVPDFIIRRVIRKKAEQFNKTILADEDNILAKEWNLGDCNDLSVAMLVGKDKKLKYIKKGKVQGDEIQKVVDMVAAEVAKP